MMSFLSFPPSVEVKRVYILIAIGCIRYKHGLDIFFPSKFRKFSVETFQDLKLKWSRTSHTAVPVVGGSAANGSSLFSCFVKIILVYNHL